ncbi:MAG: hypothetical protein AB7S75_19820 [Desulfococcaceae bacterium]
MRTKHFIAGLAAAGVLCFSAGAWAGDRFDRIQDRQTDKIYDGVRSGKISQREYDRLIEEQMRLERIRLQALEDARLTRQERVQLQRLQDRAAKNIHRAKQSTERGKKNYVYSHKHNSYKPDQRPYRGY